MSRSSKPRQKLKARPRKAGPSPGHVLIAKAIGEAARLVSGELRGCVLALKGIEHVLCIHVFDGIGED